MDKLPFKKLCEKLLKSVEESKNTKVEETPEKKPLNGFDLHKEKDFLEKADLFFGPETGFDILKSAPPDFSEEQMHKLKDKYGTESAFKIAWTIHNKKKNGKKK